MSLPARRPLRYLITRGELTESNYTLKKRETLAGVRAAVERGIEMIQIREKGLEARSLFELSSEAADLVAGSETRLLINNRFDVAIASQAHGVHLTSRSVPVAAVRAAAPTGFIVGVSTHSLGEVVDAEAEGADLAVFGNVFPTPGKARPAGLGILREVCSRVAPFPVIAIGGIDETNVGSVIDAGAAGFAAIRYLNRFVNIAEW